MLPGTALACASARCAGRWRRRYLQSRSGATQRLSPSANSDGEAGATLGTATREDLAAVGGLHACTESVVALALDVAGLVGALGGHDGTPGNAWVRPRTIAVRRHARKRNPLGTVAPARLDCK